MKLCTPGARDSLIITLEYILNQTKPGYFLGQKMAPNDHKFKMCVWIYCQAQPKLQLNWAELALVLLCAKNSFLRSLN